MQKVQKKMKFFLPVVLLFFLTGCGKLGSVINDIHGSLIGNNYTIYTYDNYGDQTLKTSGKKISITGNKTKDISYDSDGKATTGYDLSSVITITIDGKEIESCADTCIFVQKGLVPEVDFSSEQRFDSSGSNGITDNAAIARKLNRYKNDFGKSRVVVIKSQLGQPIAAFSGDDVYWEIPDDLPKMTKLMVDGKALYIHRANYQIIDKDLL